QNQFGGSLTDALVKLGFATEEAIALANSKQLNIPYASRENKLLRVERDQGLEKIVDEKFARENLVLPLFLDEKTLAVAMNDPGNLMVLENLKLMTGYEISPLISTRAQILKVIDEFYGGGGGLIEREMDKADEETDGSVGEVDTSGAR